MVYKIIDKQCGGYFAGGAEFATEDEVRDQLVSYHSIDCDEDGALEKMNLDEILDLGEWEIEEQVEENKK